MGTIQTYKTPRSLPQIRRTLSRYPTLCHSADTSSSLSSSDEEPQGVYARALTPTRSVLPPSEASTYGQHASIPLGALQKKVVFQKWRWTEIAVTLDLIFVVSLRKEWSMTFIAVRCLGGQKTQMSLFPFIDRSPRLGFSA